MTTIRPASKFGIDLTAAPSEAFDGCTYISGSGHYPTAELAAALGLPTREELDRKQAAWENECGNLEMTQRERDALRADLREADRARDAACDTRDELRAERDALRAELSESRKDTRNAEMHSETYRVKYEVAEAARAMLDRTAHALRAELDEAEATIARIKARVDASPSEWIKHELQVCLENRKSVILTATIEGLRVGNAAFIKGTLASIQTADADRLISAGLAKEAKP